MFQIFCVFSSLFISLIILASRAQSNSSPMDSPDIPINDRSGTNVDLSASSPSDFEDSSQLADANLHFNRKHYEIQKRRSKKKHHHHSARLSHNHHGKNPHHNRHYHEQSKGSGKKEKDVRTYETFEEIHEHINEPADQDGQYQASERYESHEDSSGAVQSEKEKENIPIKIKVKHHHHHHHHNHIKEVIKSVPKPYTIQKIVHVPIEKIVEKIVQVPKIVNFTIEKIVHVPVEKIIEKIVQVPKPVHIPKPYVVEKIMEKIVHVPKPYPVVRTVPYPVEIKVPVSVEKKVPVPFKVEVERKIPVYLPEPYKYEETYNKQFRGKDFIKPHSDIQQSDTIRHPSFLSENPRFNPIRHTEFPSNLDIDSFNPAIDHQLNSDLEPKRNQMEQSAAESQFLPVTFLNRDAPLNIVLADNNTAFDLNTQNYDKNIPFSIPFEFIQLHPVPFKPPILDTSFNST